MLLGVSYHGSLLGPALVSGFFQAGLYGLLAVALVLTYRVSRTVAFVHGGLAILGAMFLWWLTFPSRNFNGWQPQLPGWAGLLIIIATGLVLGAAYGKLVTSRRLADWPKLTLTTFSLGVMLIFIGVVPLFWQVYFGGFETPASPFGDGQFKLFDTVVSVHQVATLGVITGCVAVLGLVLRRTRGGVYVRAIADDVESSRWVGVPLNRVGTVVYALAGAMSCMAGALIAPVLGPGLFDVLFVFLRALTAAVLGGFVSFPLALAGSVFFGVVDSSMRAGLFGDSTAGQREMLTVGAVFLVVLLIGKYRKSLNILDPEGM